ncbi:Phosphatidylinositol 4,5-bisphosphate 5-phosphatase A-like protein [Hapsidospora chrysogenum ATCC 11550]|uniref:Phosphatidylinositol 4,5-bisphosphate 5-phosphatase A-like protein n=1 Tax=Hapsidospora chrysogenum (strain ATCC 11550 / CBS 779.69 / DSM 880 / IAM 14645 / JCM 23072 / IMI 49137) TaxID=857340 RepID=A0A086T2U9_HAPC1|nr:Phosphatidylinositol 4,5-bisphosphate 5-phosphatase A-like protein [Hapsidospora chrysogenum ATCC 11550]
MDPTEGDGPDGSSLRPVSSLLARFENISKPSDGVTPQAPQKPPSRSISPAPKPEKLRDFKPIHDAPTAPGTPTAPSTPTIPSRPRERPRSAIAPSIQPAPPVAAKPTPAAKPQVPKPQQQPPAVTIQPPQSPPKGKVSALLHDDHAAAFLNPDTVSSPVTPSGSPKPPKPLHRPTTPSPAPAIPPPRSPRSAKAPSPPPPRRSGEFRREPKPVPPPPRRDKITAPGSLVVKTNGLGPKTGELSEETSPFSSPPDSPGTDAGDTPPQLPARPRPGQNVPGSSRPVSAMVEFDPPPVHRAVAMKRWPAEANGTDHVVRAGSHPRHAAIEPPPRPASVHVPSAPPPPPRSNATNPPQHTESLSATGPLKSGTVPAKRVSSNPTTQQLLIPPSRTHGRSKTVDNRPTDRNAVETRAPQSQVTPALPPQAPSQTSTKPEPWHIATYPDCSSTNRRPPPAKVGADEISTKHDARVFDVCGEYVCTTGQLTRLWDTLDGSMLMSLAHTEGVKATAVAFKPGTDPQNEASAIWLGTSSGELMEVDLATHSITPSKGSVHQRREVIRIYRHHNELWTLDELGTLLVWGPDETGVPNVTGHPHQSYKMPREHTFSMVVGGELWHATGKEVRVFAPTLDGRVQFQVLIRPMFADGAGDITSGTLLKTQPGKVFFGHSDGKVSIFSTKDYCCIGVLNISTWKINCMVGVGHRLWLGYNTGRICVYDIGETPWTMLKEFQAHGNPVLGMKCDPATSYRFDRVQVVSLGADNKIKVWDGLLEDDWIEDEMKSKDTDYCDFDELRTMVVTWNAGASTPHSLRYSGNDGEFFPELLKSSDAPDILVFGFQELVDLEDKTATAKRFLKGKKKEGPDQEKMSHQYRDWKDFLMKTLDDYMPTDDLYHLLHTAPMVGLFTCVFVKASLRDRIRHLSGAEVKRGMGGLHGNKGAVAVRFRIDDSSICFVNCHLAAGQSQAAARHNDLAEILESSLFPAERDPAVRIDSFAGGGDGSMVVDHELCILSGDLNYRIDTMSRDTVVMAVKQNNLAKLLERDQLLVARRRNPSFRLRAFEELPITFAPTYKYDVGTDRYDTSEKRRSPAWCDRLLFRGRGRVQQLDYRRHEVYVSDHRPVTGNFRLWVKKIRLQDRSVAWMQSQQSFEAVRVRETADEK